MSRINETPMRHIGEMEMGEAFAEKRTENAGEEEGEAKYGSQTRTILSKVSVLQIFKYADRMDVVLMVLGTVGAMADGMSTPGLLMATSRLVNTLGNGASADPRHFMDQINKVLQMKGISRSKLNFKEKVLSKGKEILRLLSTIVKYVLCFVYMAIAVWVAAFMEGYCWTRTGQRQAFCIRTKYLRAVMSQDIGFFDIQGTTVSEVVTSVSKDTLVIQDVLSEKVPNFLMNASVFVFSYVVSLYLSWRLSLAAFPLLAFLVIPGLIYGKVLMEIARKMDVESSKAGSIAEQSLSNVRTVFSYVGEQRTLAKYSATLENAVNLGLKQGLAKGLAIGSNGISFAIWAFLSWYGSRLVMYQEESGGRVFAAGVSLILGGLALGTTLSNMKYFTEACIAAHRIFQMIERIPEINSDDINGQVLENVNGEVKFENVEFAYPSRPHSMILHRFCLTVPAAHTVALVGSSGSGKSTVIALLERFYDPVSGVITVDGINIKNLQLKWLRTQIGLVSQEPALFTTSIKDNILFAKEEATMKDVIAAATISNAHDFISQLPDGYDTQVGERGVQMSGGQKQRVAIARALIKNPAILLLDEATSALDAESENIVQNALDQASLGRTTIVVAHRLSTIQNANLIAVVEGGQIIEVGSHEELVHRENGAYSKLLNLQQHKTKIEQDQATRASPVRMSNVSQLSKCSSGAPIANNNNIITSPPKAPSFFRLLALNAPEWKQATVGSACAVVFGAVQPVYAFILGSMISAFFIKEHEVMKSEIRVYALVFSSLSAISVVVNVVQHYNFAAMGEMLTKRLRERMLEKVLSFEVGWFDRRENSSGAICGRLADEARVVKSLVADRLSLVLQTLSAVILAVTLGLIIAWRLAIVMIVIQPLTILCFYTRKVLLTSMSNKSRKAQNQCSQMAAEAVANHKIITSYCSKDRLLTMFKATQEEPRKEGIRQSWLAGYGIASAQCLTFLTWALDFWYGGKLMQHGLINAGDIYKTFFILVSTGRVIAEAGSMTSDIAKGSATLTSIFAILDRTSEINPDDDLSSEILKPQNLQGSIEFANVDFAYPSRPDIVVLNNFNLKVRAGSSVALVGQSGSGKSTIIGLIERFYDPLRGKVKIDGMDVKTLSLRWTREHIALVGQEPALFGGSIRENILYGRHNATDTEIIEAAKAANAHDFISSLKDGYDTYCGERGVQLSGGQKQRIAIARAIIKNPVILLLDEATSALDAQSEKVVQESLYEVMVGRTAVLVAHQLATAKNADSIAFLQDGMIVEHGNHTDLMKRGGRFFNLVKIQQRHSTNVPTKFDF